MRGGLGVDFEGRVDKWGRDLLGKGSVAVGEELDTHLGLDCMRGLRMQVVLEEVGNEGHHQHLGEVVEVVLPHPWRQAVHNFVRPVLFAEVESLRAG